MHKHMNVQKMSIRSIFAAHNNVCNSVLCVLLRWFVTRTPAITCVRIIRTRTCVFVPVCVSVCVHFFLILSYPCNPHVQATFYKCWAEVSDFRTRTFFFAMDHSHSCQAQSMLFWMVLR